MKILIWFTSRASTTSGYFASRWAEQQSNYGKTTGTRWRS